MAKIVMVDNFSEAGKEFLQWQAPDIQASI